MRRAAAMSTARTSIPSQSGCVDEANGETSGKICENYETDQRSKRWLLPTYLTKSFYCYAYCTISSVESTSTNAKLQENTWNNTHVLNGNYGTCDRKEDSKYSQASAMRSESSETLDDRNGSKWWPGMSRTLTEQCARLC